MSSVNRKKKVMIFVLAGRAGVPSSGADWCQGTALSAGSRAAHTGVTTTCLPAAASARCTHRTRCRTNPQETGGRVTAISNTSAQKLVCFIAKCHCFRCSDVDSLACDMSILWMQFTCSQKVFFLTILLYPVTDVCHQGHILVEIYGFRLSMIWFSKGLWQWVIHYTNIMLDTIHCL